jgi:hypothetical protein
VAAAVTTSDIAASRRDVTKASHVETSLKSSSLLDETLCGLQVATTFPNAPYPLTPVLTTSGKLSSLRWHWS